MKPRIIFALSSLLLLMTGCTMLRRMQGDIHYRNLYYQDAIASYTKVLEKKPDYGTIRRMADCYTKTGAVKMAEGMWRKAVASPLSTPEDQFELGMVLMQLKKYDEARIVFSRYLLDRPGDEVARNRIVACDSSTAWRQDSFLYTVKKLPGPVNNEVSNYSPAWYGSDIVFTSERTAAGSPKVAEWTHKPYSDLYSAQLSGDTVKVSPQKMEGDIEGIYHEGPLVFTSDLRKVYFTRNNYLRRKRGKSDEYVNNLKIYQAESVEGKWTHITELPFNSDEFSCGHPALSGDGQSLYFVSDRPGGFGGTDLWVVKMAGGQWGEPRNLGPRINTQGNEMFPWIGFDRSLYFASDGWPGLGGLDIFRATSYEPSTLPASEARAEMGNDSPVNMKYPINSPRDDFGFITDPTCKTGYLSSNRDRKVGVDDIFYFASVPVVFRLEGIVVTVKGHRPVRDALVELRLSSGRAVSAIQTDETGHFSFPLDAATAYSIHAAREHMFGNSDSVSTMGHCRSHTFFVTLELDSLIIGKPIVLNNIYYDFDKWDIRPDAEPDLNHLVKVMNDNPGIYVELSSHTDCRGTHKYNEKLSAKRAKSAVDYIIAHGISKERIYAKGYGETIPVNQCIDGVDCTEEAHQANRRTEFKVVKIQEPQE